VNFSKSMTALKADGCPDVVALDVVVGYRPSSAVHLERFLADEAVVFERIGCGLPHEIAEAIEERHPDPRRD